MEAVVGYHATVEEIGPERAKYLLDHNYGGNRNLRESYVNQLAEVMRQGRFVSENGQTVVVGDDDGILYDAQHRLHAIVRSGKTYKFIVAYITDGKEKFKTIDTNTPRQAADFIDLPNRMDCAAFGKVSAAIEWGNAPLLSCMQGKWSQRTSIDRGLIVLYCEQNSNKVLRCVRSAKRMRDAIGCGTVKAFSTFINIVNYIDDVSFVDSFVEDFCNLAPSNISVSACKRTIVNAHIRAKSNPEYKWMIGTLLDAYHHFVVRDGGTMLNKQERRLREYSDRLEAKRERDTAVTLS